MSPDGMGWSWQDLENTPPYVRRYCVDLLNARRRIEAGAADAARLRAKRQQGG